MLSSVRRLRLPAVLILAVLAMTLAVTMTGVSADGNDNISPVIPEKADPRYPNLGSLLDRMVAKVENGEVSAQDAAAGASVQREESVAVTIYVSGNVDDVVSFLDQAGGDPSNVGEDYIEAYVPVSLLGQVSERPGVLRVREIVPPLEEFGPTTSQGVRAHLSASWNESGYSGWGVKVGIIDSYAGFTGYGARIGVELPAPAGVRCYTELGLFTEDLVDCEGGSAHGTAVAESLVDVAPEATFYLASPRSLGDLQSAVDWMVSQGVSVIVQAETYSLDGPGDGTSPFSISPLRTVDRAVAGGVIWVAPAGNSARGTWFGGLSDADGDGFIDFVEGDELNRMSLDTGDLIHIDLRWDDRWGGATRDLDLYFTDGAGRTLLSSADGQSGASGHYPHEYLGVRVIRGGEFGLAVHHYSGSVPDWIQLQVRGVSRLERYTGNGSIGNPGESANPGMLTVGAAHWRGLRTIESFSSLGPTPDGRIKPDVVGADCGATSLTPLNEANRGFCGTSQASPHVAGMAALVRQRFPGYTPAQVASYLKDNAGQRGSPDPNNTWGHGFAQLPPIGDCSNNDGLASDCDTLLAARDTLAGAGALNWSAHIPITTWEGVTLEGSPLRVTGLSLEDRRLTGEIPPSLGDLAKLESLRLQENQLTGEIPSELGDLANLSYLALWDNRLTGSIPPELGGLANLRYLALANNRLTGAVPPELGGLANLEDLYLNVNQLVGEIPPELGDLSNLNVLNIWGNRLSGQLPIQLGNLSSLNELSLSVNDLSGELPAWLGDLSNLTHLYLDGNRLSGQIPPELGGLPSLEVLRLQENQLTGKIPSELASLVNLTWLGLGGNDLSGELPAWLGNLRDLTWLDLGDSGLSGEIPSELASLTNLTHLYLHWNQLSGEIPPELGKLSSLTWLALNGNRLSGQLPLQLDNLSNLNQLNLGSNGLSGEIPAWLGDLGNLTHLYLDGNRLSGEIPPALGNLSSLGVLRLSENQLTGKIPSELASLTNLGELDLSGNGLGGEIPSELGSLAYLGQLSLHKNRLSGQIPPELGKLSNLEQLALWDNQLSGPIPSELGSLANLTYLALSDNRLTGPIPPELGMLTSLTALYLDSNQLSGPVPSELGMLTSLQRLFLSGNQLTGCIPRAFIDVADEHPGNDPDSDLPNLGLPFCPNLAAPVLSADSYSADIKEDAAAGDALTVSPAVDANDADGDRITYELTGTGNGNFAIGIDGSVTVAQGASLDFEETSSYSLTVTASDGTLSDTAALTVTITDVDEDGTVTFDFQAPMVGMAMTATLADPDGGVTGVTWQWASADVANGTFTNISGETSASYMPVEADVGMYLRATATYADQFGSDKSAEEVTAKAVAVAGTLLDRSDKNKDGEISGGEMIAAFREYISSAGQIPPMEIIAVFRKYIADHSS